MKNLFLILVLLLFGSVSQAQNGKLKRKNPPRKAIGIHHPPHKNHGHAKFKEPKKKHHKRRRGAKITLPVPPPPPHVARLAPPRPLPPPPRPPKHPRPPFPRR